MDRLWNISHISAHLHLHCDKSLVVFSAIARSASGSKSYNMELSAVFLPRCSWLYTKLKLGRLPAVAGNIPWFDFMNLLLHILICSIKILIFSQDNINYGVKNWAHAHSDHKQVPWLHYTKETLFSLWHFWLLHNKKLANWTWDICTSNGRENKAGIIPSHIW